MSPGPGPATASGAEQAGRAFFFERMMDPLPAGNVRTNLATWAVPASLAPAVAYRLPHLAPTEAYDPDFRGQLLETIYFDTLGLALRKARKAGTSYLTLRLRCYEAEGRDDVYALSAKSESEKWRQEIDEATADVVRANPGTISGMLPPNLLGRYVALVGDEPLQKCVSVCGRRYAVEGPADRYTLDVHVHASSGKHLPFGVLEFKSTDAKSPPPGSLSVLGLPPVKLSKFLWATGI